MFSVRANTLLFLPTYSLLLYTLPSQYPFFSSQLSYHNLSQSHTVVNLNPYFFFGEAKEIKVAKMKNKASGFLKQIITYLTTMAKAKTLAFKSKTKAIKTRLVIFSLLRNKKLLMSSISQKLNGLMGQNDRNSKELEDGVAGGLGDQQSQAIMLCNSNSAMWLPSATRTEMEMEMELQEKGEFEEGEDDQEVEEKYPDLTHSLFDSEEMAFEDPGGSVIDIVKNSKEDKGEEFKLEDEIDRVADLFIRRFHRQIRLQKQLSLKRHQEMLEKSI